MAQESIKTKGVGFAPIFKHFFDKAWICEIINDNVALDARRKTYTRRSRDCNYHMNSISSLTTLQVLAICQRNNVIMRITE